MESMKNTLQSAPPDKVFLAYVNRKPLDNMDMRWGRQVLAGASLSENEVLDWIEKGKQVEHEILYEELILENPHEVPGTPKEVLCISVVLLARAGRKTLSGWIRWGVEPLFQ